MFAKKQFRQEKKIKKNFAKNFQKECLLKKIMKKKLPKKIYLLENINFTKKHGQSKVQARSTSTSTTI